MRESASTTTRLRAWSGSLHDLQLLQGRLQDLLDAKATELKAAVRQDLDQKKQEARTKYGNYHVGLDPDLEAAQRDHDQLLAQLADGWKLECKLEYAELGRLVQGRAAEVLADPDLRGLKTLSLEYVSPEPWLGYEIRILFSAKGVEYHANELRIAAPDIGWLHRAKGQLETQLRRNRPWFWPVLVPFAVGPAVAIILLAVWFAAVWLLAVDTRTILSMVLSILAVAAGLGWASARLIRWLLPPFTVQDRMSSGQRHLRVTAVVFSALFQIALAAGVPFLLS